MLNFEMNNGKFIPALGLGTAKDARTTNEHVMAAVLSAIKIGYRHIDTAIGYKTEVGVGEGLQEAFKTGLVMRKDMFVTTKVWCDKLAPMDILSELHKSLKRLQIEYVDLLLIHMPLRIKPGVKFSEVTNDHVLPLDLKGTWQAFEHAMHLQFTKSIGVSNFCVKKLQELLIYAKVVPVVNQIQLHPFWQQKNLKIYCEKKGIHVIAWAPLGAANTYYGSNDLLSNPILREIAYSHGKTTAQICLRWAVEGGCSVVPKSFSEKHQRENFEIFDFELTKDDHAKILMLSQTHLPIDAQTSKGYYKVFVELWDDEELE